MDTGSGGLLGAAQPRGHRGVVELVDDPQPDSVAFGGGELGERLGQGGARQCAASTSSSMRSSEVSSRGGTVPASRR
jgi:hypothetical protein